MQTLQIDLAKARKLFSSASPEFKEILIDSFGKDFFSQKITDRVKTFEDACKEIAQDPDDENFSTGTPDEIAYKKLKVIARALNEGKVFSFANSDQRKWYPYFQFSGSGFRFGVTAYDCTGTDSAGGSRLCFHSDELAKYVGTQFIELYNQLLN